MRQAGFEPTTFGSGGGTGQRSPTLAVVVSSTWRTGLPASTGQGGNGAREDGRVLRDWSGASFDFPEFWNPKMRGPICFNPPAARSILPLTFKRTELVLAGRSKTQVVDSIKAFDKKGLPALEPGGMSYMMSSRGYLNDSAGHWVPHLMFYVPQTDGAVWGADLRNSPVMLNPQFQGAPEPVSVFMIPVRTWSDGSAAPSNAH